MKQVVDAIIKQLDDYAKSWQIKHGRIVDDQQKWPGIHPLDLDDNATPIGHANNTAWVCTLINNEKDLYTKLLTHDALVPQQVLLLFKTIKEKEYHCLPMHERHQFIGFIKSLREEYLVALDIQKTLREENNPFLKLARPHASVGEGFQDTLSYWQQKTSDPNGNTGKSRL